MQIDVYPPLWTLDTETGVITLRTQDSPAGPEDQPQYVITATLQVSDVRVTTIEEWAAAHQPA